MKQVCFSNLVLCPFEESSRIEATGISLNYKKEAVGLKLEQLTEAYWGMFVCSPRLHLGQGTPQGLEFMASQALLPFFLMFSQAALLRV